MTREDIISLTTELFKRYPYDSPDRLFKLAGEWLVYCEAWKLQPFGGSVELVMKEPTEKSRHMIENYQEYLEHQPPLDEIIDSSPLDGAGG